MPYNKAAMMQERFQLSTTRELWFDPRWRRYSNDLFRTPDGVPLYKTAFPYQLENLPAPIPTPQEIAAKAETDADFTARIPSRNKLFRFGPYVIKVALSPSLFQEAENMWYVAKHTSVRVPKIYAAFTDDTLDPRGPIFTHYGATWYYLVMEYIPGVELYTAEKIMSEDRRRQVYSRLMEEVHRLRSHRLPDDNQYYGRVLDQPVGYNNVSIFIGPGRTRKQYLTYSDLLADMREAMVVTRLRQSQELEISERAARFFDDFEEMLGRSAKEPRLTHCDIKGNNIIYREIEGPNGGDFELTIIDWEHMTWAPQWAEAGCMMLQNPKNQTLYKALEQEFSASELETAKYILECKHATGYSLI